MQWGSCAAYNLHKVVKLYLPDEKVEHGDWVVIFMLTVWFCPSNRIQNRFNIDILEQVVCFLCVYSLSAEPFDVNLHGHTVHDGGGEGWSATVSGRFSTPTRSWITNYIGLQKDNQRSPNALLQQQPSADTQKQLRQSFIQKSGDTLQHIGSKKRRHSWPQATSLP